MQADSTPPAPLPLFATVHSRDAIAPVSPQGSSVSDSNRKHHTQVESLPTGPSGCHYTGFVGKRGAKGGTKELPLAMRLSIAQYLNAAMTEHGWSVREAREATGIDISTLSRARRADGATGVHLLLKLRELVREPIDTILGLPPIEKREPATSAPVVVAAVASDAPIEPATAADPRWAQRDHAVRLARIKGVPENIIQAVLAEYADKLYLERKRWWWVTTFEEAYGKAREHQRSVAIAATATRVERAPKSLRGRRKRAG